MSECGVCKKQNDHPVILNVTLSISVWDATTKRYEQKILIQEFSAKFCTPKCVVESIVSRIENPSRK